MSSWLGSGIFATEVERYVECDAPSILVDPETGEKYEDTEHTCGFEGDVDVHVNDYQDGTWTCPTCGATHDIDRDTLYARTDL